VPDGISAAILQPAVALSILVGSFSTSAFLVIFGRIGWHTIATFALASLGAWVGDALLGPGTILRLGDYSLLGAAVGAWVAIAAVEGAAWYRDRGRDDTAPAATGTDPG
jgi:hypothetical protein